MRKRLLCCNIFRMMVPIYPLELLGPDTYSLSVGWWWIDRPRTLSPDRRRRRRRRRRRQYIVNIRMNQQQQLQEQEQRTQYYIERWQTHGGRVIVQSCVKRTERSSAAAVAVCAQYIAPTHYILILFSRNTHRLPPPPPPLLLIWDLAAAADCVLLVKLISPHHPPVYNILPYSIRPVTALLLLRLPKRLGREILEYATTTATAITEPRAAHNLSRPFTPIQKRLLLLLLPLLLLRFNCFNLFLLLLCYCCCDSLEQRSNADGADAAARQHAESAVERGEIERERESSRREEQSLSLRE